MYPQLTINLKKLGQNLDAVAKITRDQGGCSLMIVTKSLCADEKVVELLINDKRVDYLADSRIENLKTYSKKARECGKKTVMMRLPMHCEIPETVEHADLSFNSEISTIRLLDREAERRGKVHSILLMVDLGDLREGLFYADEMEIFTMVSEILKLKNIELFGIGVNLTCYGAIIPKDDNLSVFAGIAEKIERKFNIKLQMLSGGNSSSIYLIWKGGLPKGINNLRLGESFLLGNDTAYGEDVPGTVRDAITLEAQIIELREKPSLPIGEAGLDAFGRKPHYEDRGVIKRAILAVGKQDIDQDSLTPVDNDVEILGSSSDHLILDVTKSGREYEVGGVVSFSLAYGAVLRAATSKYVKKVYVE